MFDDFLNSAVNILSSIRILDLLDILVVAFAIYKVIGFIRKTRAQQLVKGLLILIIIMLLSNVLKLYTVHFILYNGLAYGLIAIMVIFYPELRRALEYLGRSKFTFLKQSASIEKSAAKELISHISKTIEYFSSNKVGALIIFERDIALGDIMETGTKVDAEVTSMLLRTIFYEGSALHDGAVIIRNGRLLAAGCVLPLTRNNSLEATLGTRHRAGIGITEVSDAISIIVSEETGIISMASEGKLSRFLDIKTIEKMLYNIYLSGIDSSDTSRTFLNLFRRKRDGK